MSFLEILEFVLLPINGWLLYNSLRNAERLTRIETMMKYVLAQKGINLDDEN